MCFEARDTMWIDEIADYYCATTGEKNSLFLDKQNAYSCG